MAITDIGSASPIDLLTPRLDADIFSNYPDATFYVGILAVPGLVVQPSAWQAARCLRANVYIDEKQFLPPSARQLDGGEQDEYDERSVQFGIVENRGDSAAMVGTSRLILKRDSDETLPVEKMFPELFDTQAALPDTSETSRYIARHPNRSTQHAVGIALVRAMTLYAVDKDTPNSYAVVERSLAKIFDWIHLPYRVMTAPKPIAYYNNTQNLAIGINGHEIVDAGLNTRMGSEKMNRLFRPEVVGRLGLGGFDATLTEVIQE